MGGDIEMGRFPLFADEGGPGDGRSASWRLLSSTYLRDIGKIPLLSPGDEQACAKRFREAFKEVKTFIAQHLELPAVFLDIQYRKGKHVSFLDYLCSDVVVSLEMEMALMEQIKAMGRNCHNVDDFRKAYSALTRQVEFGPSLIFDSLEYIFDHDCSEFGPVAPAIQEVKDKLQDAHQKLLMSRNALIEGNLRLVVSIARSYLWSNLSLEDLVQEGNLGLMRAVESFDFERGNRFCTYASYWIRQSVIRAVNFHGRLIRMPVYVIRELGRIAQCERHLLQLNDSMPTPEDIAKELSMSPSRVRALQRMAQQPISLCGVAPDGRSWDDILPDTLLHTSDEENLGELRNGLSKVLESLEPREREIIIRHFGLEGHESETLEQIGVHFGLTSERIRQIEYGALRKMRTPLRQAF